MTADAPSASPSWAPPAAATAEIGLFLDGLRCSGCVARVERLLRETAGVRSASVNHTNHRALVGYDPAAVDPDALVARVATLGYEATPFDPDALERPSLRSAREALVRVLVAAFLAGNVMMFSAALYIGSYQGIDPDVRAGLRWLALALSVPAITWCAAPFWRGAFAGLRRREITIDVPIALGIAVAWGASLVGTLQGVEHVFIDSATMIVFLVLLGRTLERSARARASGAVERLVALAPERALRRGADGALADVLARSLVAGDRVVVAPGQAFPADGLLVAGATEVDEALFTGESRPVARAAGQRVTGGSRNVLAEVEAEVLAPIAEGTLARLAGLLERAQADRPRVQRIADRVAAVFAPTVLAIAAATALGWRLAGASWLDVAMTASAVLIVACPCALGLATPAAMAAALGRAAKFGVLFKSGEAIERTAAARAALLDKTGTVTEARLAVEDVAAAPGWTADRVLSLAAAVEGRSTHPLAVAIREEAERRGLAPAAFDERRAVAGRGVVARAQGGGVAAVGSQALLEESGVALPPALAAAAEVQAARGASLAFVAAGGEAVGVLALTDPPRPDAAEAVARLRRLGLRVSLVSGDHADAVRLAAERAGIEDALAGVRPEEKVERVHALRAAGAVVLVAGDGINDAAALAAADVGLAMGRGADVAVHAADAVVLAPRLGALADAVGLARAALRRVRENLGLAVLYNLLAVPLAAAGWLEPLAAALAMSLSSLVVTANATRLLGWRPRP
jgi:heavy metal translocating P-type ATPase